MSEAQADAAVLELQLRDNAGVIGGCYAIYGDSESDIDTDDFEANNAVADPFEDQIGFGFAPGDRQIVFGDADVQDLDDGNVIVIGLELANGDWAYAAYEIVVD